MKFPWLLLEFRIVDVHYWKLSIHEEDDSQWSCIGIYRRWVHGSIWEGYSVWCEYGLFLAWWWSKCWYFFPWWYKFDNPSKFRIRFVPLRFPRSNDHFLQGLFKVGSHRLFTYLVLIIMYGLSSQLVYYFILIST